MLEAFQCVSTLDGKQIKKQKGTILQEFFQLLGEEMPSVAAAALNQDPENAAMVMNDGEDESSSSNATVSLDSKIWNKLPPELLEKIHLCLPLISLVRFRSVCKAWDRSVFDEGFIQARKQSVSQKPWIIVTTTALSMSMFDTGDETWIDIPIPFNASKVHVVAAAGGLLCFSNAWFQWPGMYVGNPVTNRWRHLPPMNTFLIITVGMVYFDDTQTFKVFVCGRREDDNLITEVYDSVEDSWTPGGLPAASRKYGGDTLVWRDGVFYCLTFPYSTLNLIAYDLAKGIWFDVPVYMPSAIMSPNVVACHDKLLLIYAMEAEEGHFVIRVSELDFDIYEWVEVERMPPQMCREFENLMVQTKPLCCFSTGDLIFFTISSNTTYYPGAVFDLKNRVWTWWPSAGFPPHLPEVNMGRTIGLSFEPRLHALV